MAMDTKETSFIGAELPSLELFHLLSQMLHLEYLIIRASLNGLAYPRGRAPSSEDRAISILAAHLAFVHPSLSEHMNHS
jgi:hypothetical protein